MHWLTADFWKKKKRKEFLSWGIGKKRQINKSRSVDEVESNELIDGLKSMWEEIGMQQKCSWIPMIFHYWNIYRSFIFCFFFFVFLSFVCLFVFVFCWNNEHAKAENKGNENRRASNNKSEREATPISPRNTKQYGLKCKTGTGLTILIRRRCCMHMAWRGLRVHCEHRSVSSSILEILQM